METEDWKLHAFLDWKPKHKTVDCDYCGGNGYVGGGFKSIDGKESCPQCWGAKIKTVSPTSEKPEIPSALIEHMRRAWWDYFNK